MVRITFFQNQEQNLTGFDCLGHAEYTEENDIVCAAVSALVITCINSIETLTEDRFSCESSQTDGRIVFRMSEDAGTGSQLLLQSLALGLEEMESNYGEFIDLIFEEV
ncbi:MAG: ribosomal-processing cysteine protease Prp [Clostridiales bacterium]|nr:ribosomal-processing cysteine protease Prp [Clostridiales bacterium]